MRLAGPEPARVALVRRDLALPLALCGLLLGPSPALAAGSPAGKLLLDKQSVLGCGLPKGRPSRHLPRMESAGGARQPEGGHRR